MMYSKHDQYGRNFRNSLCLLFFVALLFAMLGCAAIAPRPLPPITENPTGIYHEGKVVWHDLLTEDVEAVPLPDEPPDMGIPDIEIEPFD